MAIHNHLQAFTYVCKLVNGCVWYVRHHRRRRMSYTSQDSTSYYN